MSKPDPYNWPQRKLSKAHTQLIKGTDESARVKRQPMLDEGDDEIFDTFNKDFASIFDDPEKL